MPYALIPLIAAIVLAFQYVVVTDASVRSKWIVGGIAAASLVIYWRFPRWQLGATLLQVVVSIYVLLYLKAASDAS